MKINRVLRQITSQIYKNRPAMQEQLRTNYRIERVNSGLLCDLWFLTSGCIHDRQGGCVMCNYGKPGKIADWKKIVSELERIVEKLPWEFEDFLLTPSGSMLDEREVSADMRRDLEKLLKPVRTKRLIIETRADTVTADGLDFMKKVLPDTEKYIEIGVECADNWVLKNCINKNLTYAAFQNAVKLIHRNGMHVTANIGLGFPFMSERASIRYSIQSIKKALADKADSVVLFPYHIKKGTLLESMAEHSMYHCVSLWALTEVLGAFSPEELTKIQISWYKDYFGEKRSFILQSPETCPVCGRQVMELLDQYRDTQDAQIVLKLKTYPCRCREKWREDLNRQDPDIRMDQVEQAYRKLAEIFSVDQELLEQELNSMRRESGKTDSYEEVESASS